MIRQFQIIFFVVLCLTFGFRDTYADQEFSADCKSWNSFETASPPIAGYVKSNSSNVYFDSSKKIWMNLSEKPMVFVLKESEVLILTPQTVEVISYTAKHPDKIVEIMSALAEFGEKMLNESRWVFRIKNDETFIAGLFANNKKCTSSPKARAIMCRKKRPCSLVPPNKTGDSFISSCAKELGLLDPIIVGRLKRACSIIGDGSTYESVLQIYAKAKTACGVAVPDLTPLQRMKQACEEGRSLLDSMK